MDFCYNGVINTTITKMTIYFWKCNETYGMFSQWYPSSFIIDGIKFNCAEQYMMYSKAKLFQDEEIALKILGEQSPRKQKDLGRSIRNFDEETWISHRYNIVYQGTYAKFNQNPSLKKQLLSTGDSMICEASPYDCIWGIGITQEQSEQGAGWRGENLLGQILMKVREDINE